MVKYVTKNWPRVFLLCLFIVILSSSFYGCGGTFRSFPSEGDVSGSWTLFLASSGTSSIGPKVMTLTQSNSNIVGTTADGALVTGSISSSDTITLTLANADKSTTTLSGSVAPDWKAMSGTFTSTGSDGSGTWTATKIIPTPTPVPLAVVPTSTTLGCTGGAQATTFQISGGTKSKYSVTVPANTLITLDKTSLTTNGQFTVTANACVSSTNPAASTAVDLTVTDTVTTLTVTVTVTNP